MLKFSDYAKFSALQGKILTKIEGAEKGSELIRFYCSDGSVFAMYHNQDCCESVSLEDVCGDVEGLISSVILDAYETYDDNEGPLSEYDDSYTWTFYTIVNFDITVTLRWYGSSNGYYSESVSFYKEK